MGISPETFRDARGMEAIQMHPAPTAYLRRLPVAVGADRQDAPLLPGEEGRLQDGYGAYDTYDSYDSYDGYDTAPFWSLPSFEFKVLSALTVSQSVQSSPVQSSPVQSSPVQGQALRLASTLASSYMSCRRTTIHEWDPFSSAGA
eukprot:gene15121-biopygen2807